MSTFQEKREAVQREIAYRRRVYPRLVAGGKMTQALADKQIALFEEIERDYTEMAAKERLL